MYALVCFWQVKQPQVSNSGPKSSAYLHSINHRISQCRVKAQLIDYTCECARCVTISNPDSLCRCEAEVDPGVRSWKRTYLTELDVRRSLVTSISQSTEELRLYNSPTGLKICQFHTHAKKRFLQTHFLTEWFVFLRDNLGNWKR